jgi:hypothetical protein
MNQSIKEWDAGMICVRVCVCMRERERVNEYVSEEMNVFELMNKERMNCWMNK